MFTGKLYLSRKNDTDCQWDLFDFWQQARQAGLWFPKTHVSGAKHVWIIHKKQKQRHKIIDSKKKGTRNTSWYFCKKKTPHVMCIEQPESKREKENTRGFYDAANLNIISILRAEKVVLTNSECVSDYTCVFGWRQWTSEDKKRIKCGYMKKQVRRRCELEESFSTRTVIILPLISLFFDVFIWKYITESVSESQLKVSMSKNWCHVKKNHERDLAKA